MKKIRIRFTALLLVLVLLSASVITVHAAPTTGLPTTYSKQYNSGTRNVVCTTLSGTSADLYYANYDYDDLSELSQSQLFSKLQTLMRTTHTYISSYNDCHYKANQTDCTNGSGSNVSLIYTSYSATMDQWNGWNREHVWPKSLGGNSQTGGGADMHHIRPADASVNTSRSNKKYGEAGSNPTAKYGANPASGYLGGHYNSTYYEPLDNVKGDVARICLYVYVRWNSDWGASNITSVFQSVDVLLEWCELDPVDSWEMGRNEVIGAIQGNRNVFIDYPEYAWLIFGKEVPDDMVTPSGKAMADSDSDNSDPKPVDPGVTDPNPSNPDNTDPDINNPDINNPDTNNPDTNNPDTNNPDTNNPDTNTPDTNNPDTNNPDTNTSEKLPDNSTEATEQKPSDGGECTHIFSEWVNISSSVRARTCSECGISEVTTGNGSSSEPTEDEGCSSTVYSMPLIIVSVALLTVALTARKRKREQ